MQQQFEKTITLDYSTWRSGDGGPHSVGEGFTQLCNSQGYMCCLGQAALQLDPTLTKDDITNKRTPNNLDNPVPFLVLTGSHTYMRNSAFTFEAMNINDAHHTTPEKKIELLTELFNDNGLGFEVINKP